MNTKDYDKQIEENIDVALKSNKLHYFLLGVGFYKIYTPPYAQMVVHSAGIMNSLYRYSKNNRNIQAEVQSAFELIAGIKTFYAVDATMELVYYHLAQEKQGLATFHLDCRKILDILSNNIKSNLDFYKSKGELEDIQLENGLYPTIMEYNEKLGNEYNHRIM